MVGRGAELTKPAWMKAQEDAMSKEEANKAAAARAAFAATFDEDEGGPPAPPPYEGSDSDDDDDDEKKKNPSVLCVLRNAQLLERGWEVGQQVRRLRLLSSQKTQMGDAFRTGVIKSR